MSRKRVKTPQNSTSLELLDNNRTWADLISESGWSLFPEKGDWRKRFCATMLDWAHKEDSLEITDFAISMKIRREMIYDWCKRYPEVKDVFDHVKLIIASRRKKGALTRKFDKDVVFKDMHRYDAEWLEINKYHADLKKEDEDKKAQVFNVYVTKPEVTTKEAMKGEKDV